MGNAEGDAFPYERWVALRNAIERFHEVNFPDSINRDPDGSSYSTQDGASGITARVSETSLHQWMNGMLALRLTTLQDAGPKEL